MSKDYTALPLHTAIYYQITFNFIDKFKNPDYFTLTLDSTSVPGGSSLKIYNSYVTSNLCGGSDADTTQFTIAGSMPHTSNTLAFKLIVKAATGSGSGTLGIRDIQLTFVNDSSVTTSSSCFRVFDSQHLGLSGECSCGKGSYLSSGSCTACDSACQNCFGPSASQCFACASGYSFTGSQCIQCDSSCLTCSGPGSLQCVACQDGYWLQANGSCTLGCDLPVGTRQEVGNLQLCSTKCANSQYLLWDETCVNNCSLPLVISTIEGSQLCNKPCDNNEFLDWNNVCVASCPSPLVTSIINQVDLCNKPCQNNDYLYSDGSCLPTCPSPFLQSSTLNINLCQPPCSNSQFLYPNGSCSAQCPVPLVPSTPIDGIKRCNSPCSNPSDYYYKANNICGASCSFPNTIQTIEFLKVCLISPPLAPPTDQGGLTKNEIQSVDQAKATTNAAGAAASTGMAASSIISSHGSGAITLVSLIKMLDYIRFVKINYPPKLEYMMSSQNRDPVSLNFHVDLPRSIERKFPNYPLPGKFGEYHMASNFIVNYWEALFTLGILLLVLTASILLASRARHVKYIGDYSRKIRDILKWNLFLIIFCGNIDSVGVFSSLELRTTQFNSFASVSGTLICVFINLLVLYLMLMVPCIIYSLRRARRKVLVCDKVLQPGEYNAKADAQRFALCGVLFMNFKKRSIFQHSCMFFILLRVYLFNIIIGYLFEYPLTQAILITIMSLLMLSFFVITRPFKNPLELIKTLTYEIIIAMVNICVLILAVMDHNDLEYPKNRVQLGDVIIFSNMFFNLMAVFFMITELVIKIIKAYKLRRTILAKGGRYWVNIVALLLKPEELEIEDEAQKKEDLVLRTHDKYTSKIVEILPSTPQKTVPLKGQTLSDDQSGHDSDTPPEKLSSPPKRISSPASAFSLNKVLPLKTNSILSLDAFSDFGSKNNLLTPANARTSILFSQGQLSPRSLLQSQDSQSVTPSSRMLIRLSRDLSFQDLEMQNKSRSETLSVGTPVKLNQDKGILAQRHKSTEVYLNHGRDRRRNMRFSTLISPMFDNSESGIDFSFEVSGGLMKSGVTSPHHQSRFSKEALGKSKILLEGNNNNS